MNLFDFSYCNLIDTWTSTVIDKILATPIYILGQHDQFSNEKGAVKITILITKLDYQAKN